MCDACPNNLQVVSLHLVEIMGVLKVKVVNLENLPDKDMMGKTDPYVIIEIEKDVSFFAWPCLREKGREFFCLLLHTLLADPLALNLESSRIRLVLHNMLCSFGVACWFCFQNRGSLPSILCFSFLSTSWALP